jgi:transcriptional regulator of heat shock response
LSHRLQQGLSSGGIRNATTYLLGGGLLKASHTSVERRSLERILRIFVDGLLEFNVLMTDTSAYWRLGVFATVTTTLVKLKPKSSVIKIARPNPINKFHH